MGYPEGLTPQERDDLLTVVLSMSGIRVRDEQAVIDAANKYAGLDADLDRGKRWVFALAVFTFAAFQHLGRVTAPNPPSRLAFEPALGAMTLTDHTDADRAAASRLLDNLMETVRNPDSPVMRVTGRTEAYLPMLALLGGLALLSAESRAPNAPRMSPNTADVPAEILASADALARALDEALAGQAPTPSLLAQDLPAGQAETLRRTSDFYERAHTAFLVGILPKASGGNPLGLRHDAPFLLFDRRADPDAAELLALMARGEDDGRGADTVAQWEIGPGADGAPALRLGLTWTSPIAASLAALLPIASLDEATFVKIAEADVLLLGCVDNLDDARAAFLADRNIVTAWLLESLAVAVPPMGQMLDVLLDSLAAQAGDGGTVPGDTLDDTERGSP